MKYSGCFVLLACVLGLAPAAIAQNSLAPVAPWLDEQVLAVGHVDLRRLDPAAAVKTLGELAPQDDREFPKRLAMLETQMKETLHAFQHAGIEQVFAVVSLADLPKEPFFLVLPIKAGRNPKTATEVVSNFVRGNHEQRVLNGSIVIATPEIHERLEDMRPEPRPELVKAYEKAGDASARLVFAPTEDTRRVLREMLPRLPDELGGGSGKMLVNGLQWAVVSVEPPPKMSLDVTVQSNDADSAAALRGMVVSLLQLAGKDEQVQRQLPRFNDLAAALTPKLSGDQLRLTLNEQNGGAEQLLKLLVPPVQAARLAAGRAQSVNNLKQIALAMHNYHDVHLTFPPPAIRSKDGKALLSWRVAILPFLEHGPLYQQFKLDEPWDSPHNKALVEKMPAVYASPALTDAMRAKGLTTYVAPVADKTVFSDPAGTKISRIIDGTSNTLAVVEAHPSHGVPWSAPTEIAPDFAVDPLAELRGQPNDGFNAAFCDGSVRFISIDIQAEMFKRLLQIDDGEVVELP